MDGIGYKDLTQQLLGVAKAKAGRVEPAFSGRRVSRTSGGSDILFLRVEYGYDASYSYMAQAKKDTNGRHGHACRDGHGLSLWVVMAPNLHYHCVK